MGFKLFKALPFGFWNRSLTPVGPRAKLTGLLELKSSTWFMAPLVQLLSLFVAAVILAAAARRVGAPYPVFLAIGGALLAFLPGALCCAGAAGRGL